jgi:hypothetical protein
MSKLTQPITDICFEEGQVTKPMVDRLERLFKDTMLELVGWDDTKQEADGSPEDAVQRGYNLRGKHIHERIQEL